MDETRGITVKVQTSLHTRAKTEQESLEMTMSQYITMVLEEHFNKKTEGDNSMYGTRTMAFQVDDKLFQRLKAHLARNPKLTQKSFVIGLVEKALDDAEAALEPADRPEPDTEQRDGVSTGESSEQAETE